MTEALRSYLFVGDTTHIGFRVWLDGIDLIGPISNWFQILPDAAILVSSLDLDQLHSELKARFPSRRYILVEVDRTNKNGRLPRQAWDFMNHPSAVA